MNKVFWLKEEGQDNEKRGFVARIEYGKDGVELFDEKKGMINFDVLKPHIGEKIEFYRNNELVDVRTIGGIEKNEDGVKTLYMDSIEEVATKADNEI